jgi:hypothetical protein
MDDPTMGLEDFRAALLLEREDSEGLGWKSPENSFMKIATSQDNEEVLKRLTAKMKHLKTELTSASLALAPGGKSFAVHPPDALEDIASLQAELVACNAALGAEDALEHADVQVRFNFCFLKCGKWFISIGRSVLDCSIASQSRCVRDDISYALAIVALVSVYLYLEPKINMF